MATITARDVAAYFLANVDVDSGDNLSNLKLQKLVYYAQGFHLALNDCSLFDDPIIAWSHGPVVVDLYHENKQYGSNAIPPPETVNFEIYDTKTRDLLDEVLEVYGQFSAWKLRDMTHEEPPWQETPTNGIISHASMTRYFRTLLVNGEK